MKKRFRSIFPLLLAGTTPALAQLGLPAVGPAADRVAGAVGQALDRVGDAAGTVAERATALANERTARLADLVRRHPDAIERDAAGDLARKGELLVIAATEADRDLARAAGYAEIGTERLGELGLVVTRILVPPGTPLREAERDLHRILPQATISADTLHFPAGSSARAENRAIDGKKAQGTVPVGVIDGAPGAALGALEVQGFARGAPRANDHASALVSLLQGAGVRKIAVADVYGADPAGGNALAITRGMNWLISRQMRVISLSLAGPPNPLVEQAVAAAQRRGVVLVAAVGNDGPAAPPAYPASYPGVLAVTGVDGRNRALIEAGRARHLDYAAPGADMVAANAGGRRVRVRGTSYAVPLVAARAAAALQQGAPVVPTLNTEAQDLGARGADPVYGRGLLCGSCRQRP